MKIVRVVSIIAVTLFALVSSAHAQDGRISISAAIAVDPSLSGTVLNPGVAGPATFTGTKWTESHSTNSPLLEVDLGYTVAPRTEVLGGFEYGRAGSNLLTVGSQLGAPLNASFSPYQFWGFNGGVRAGLDHGHGGYGVATFGFRQVSSIDMTLTQPGFTSIRSLYDSTTAPSFGFGGGYLFGGSTGVSFGFELAFKHTGSLAPAAASPQLSAINAESARWSLPIGFIVRF
ncbi:MAG TPA: hypothetical protein VGG73_07715 [Vicinamibacterales bacterium]